MRLADVRSRSARLFSALVAALAAIAVAGPPARAATSDAAIPPAMSCEALAKVDLGQQDAQVLSAATSNRDGHAYCDVKGYISPVTQFEALLPLQTWRGDYLQQGCGGFCGMIALSLQDPARTSGYQVPYPPLANGEMVVAADDEGHETASVGDVLWAKSDPELRVVFGYTSEHQLAQAAKALIHAFYNRDPSHSYFSGVSDGGREALVLAQRYPEDFNGIIAGAPANNWAPLNGLFQPWLASTNRNAGGKQILTAEKLPALHAAVMAACADQYGVIHDPRACSFDPASVRCAEGVDQPSCLTNEQVQAVREIYRGPHDGQGRNLFDGGEPYGSELAWKIWLVMPADDPAAPADTVSGTFGTQYLNNTAFASAPPTPYVLGAVPFTAEMHEKLEELGGIVNATDPDLGAFRDHGGKIIIYHGFADQAIPPFSTLDYYRAVAKEMGGYPAIQSFSRLYMIPGLYHCPCGQPVDGDPATAVQFLPQLAAWVERGEAPGDIVLPVTAKSVGDPLTDLMISPFDPTQPAPPNKSLNNNYDYLGAASDFQKGNELWCKWDEQRLICAPRS